MSVKQLFDLTGQVALVTGGSRGLGLQMAEALGEMGAKLAITARKADELAEAKKHLEGMGYEVLTVVNDLQKTEDIPGLVDQVVERFGTIDILVNNAGATWGAKAEDYPDAAWHKVMDLNVSAPFFLSREVGKRCMIPRGKGSIIVTASVAALKGTPPGHEHHCLQHLQGRRIALCTHAGVRMGALRRSRQRDLPRLLPEQDGEWPHRKAGPCDDRAHAPAPHWRRRGPQGRGGVPGVQRLAAHHG